MFALTSSSRSSLLAHRRVSSAFSSSSKGGWSSGRNTNTTHNATTKTTRTKKGTTMRIKIEAASSSSSTGEESDDEDSIAAIERRLKNAKNKVKLDSKRAAPNDEKTTVSGKREEGGGRPSTFFDDLGMKRSFPTPGANGMLSMWEGDPDGWEKMDPLKKLWVVWSGEKGVMYWMNQGSLYGAGFIAFCWVCFRFVGPILGLYELK